MAYQIGSKEEFDQKVDDSDNWMIIVFYTDSLGLMFPSSQSMMKLSLDTVGVCTVMKKEITGSSV